jgi:mono/diheme cytochrome c family protein
LRAVALFAVVAWCPVCFAAESEEAKQFRKEAVPILEQFCSDCHNANLHKGGVSFELTAPDSKLLDNRDLWWKALKMVRAGLMPPKKQDQPSAEQIAQLEQWIKRSGLHLDPKNPDPGRVTVRRLNRIEYRNTIRDLMGVDFNTAVEFPPDDTGHGFDNIGDVLSLSPLLLEKYIAAARTIVARAVPMSSTVVAEKRVPGRRFQAADEKAASTSDDGPLSLSYYKAAQVAHSFRAEHAGRYQLVLDLTAAEKYVDGVFDYNKCRLIFKADGKTLLDREYTRQGGKPFHYELDLDQDWPAGAHELTLEVAPLTPKEKQVRSLTLRIDAVTVRGPLSKEYWVKPPNYERYFPKAVPEGSTERRQYARELLNRFATRAFRRPVDEETVERLATLAERVYSQKGRTFEEGIAQAMTAVLASSRFLFREEGVEAGPPNVHPFLDEYALASRLSYFLWSTMPDDELFRLAGANKLRANLKSQVARMLADPRSSELMRHFTGQWLAGRDVESVEINARAVLMHDEVQDPKVQQQRARFRELIRKAPENLTPEEKKELADARAAFFGSFRRFAQFNLTGDLRRAMRRETEMLFEHVVRQDRSLLELLDSDYTFLNERLANHYGIEGVKGDQMRLVKLPPDSPRGGVLTQGTVLITTSNPDRTSPVKRGLFILDNILGLPPAPPPPDIPALEEAVAGLKGPLPTLRETLKLHRSQPLCNSCHNRMDPLGLALENFNALGRWRDKERNQPIDSAGQLITGESFTNVRELKRILVTKHYRDFYRCLSEKMLTYALGRGLDYHDVQTVDEIVARLEKENGRPSVLLMGIIESAPFQKRRALREPETPATGQGKSGPNE